MLFALTIVVEPRNTVAQPPGPAPTVGYLGGSTSQSQAPALTAFRQGLRDNGYVEGTTITVHYRWAEGNDERYPMLVQDLLRFNPAVLVSECGPALQAIRKASLTIPVVISACLDPKNFLDGEIASFARPGGQTTGFTFLAPEATGKRFEILKEIVPRLSRLAVLQNTEAWLGYWEAMRTAASALDITLHRFEVRHSRELDRVFAAVKNDRMDAMVVLTDGALTFSSRKEIADLAMKHRIPTAFDLRGFVLAGGLMAYGAPAPDLYRAAAGYVARILNGARPGDLPVQQPTRFDLIINLKTAKTLGLTIPPAVRLRAAEVID